MKADYHEASDLKAVTTNFLTKCGEVFLRSREKESFIFFCTLCGVKCLHLDTFTNHIKDSHMIEESVKQEESEPEESIKQEESEPEESVEQEESVTHIVNEPGEGVTQEECTPELENSLTITIISNDVFRQQTNEKPDESFEEEFLFTDESCANNPVIYESSQTTAQAQYFINNHNADEKSQFPIVYPSHSPKLKKEAKQFQCSKCTKCFKRKSSLKAHELTHESVKPYACDQCGHAFASKQNLVIHVRRHVGEKPFKCKYCVKAFVSSTERYSHERLHSGLRPFLCEECGKGHATSSQLSKHKRRHAGDRSFKCTDCEKRFNTGWHMRNHHSLVHANLPRKHCCSDCGAGFKTGRSLKQHEKIHAKVKMYKCRFCSKEFSQNAGLYAHMKTH